MFRPRNDNYIILDHCLGNFQFAFLTIFYNKTHHLLESCHGYQGIHMTDINCCISLPGISVGNHGCFVDVIPPHMLNVRPLNHIFPQKINGSAGENLSFVHLHFDRKFHLLGTKISRLMLIRSIV